jgi:hypothetical protein
MKSSHNFIKGNEKALLWVGLALAFVFPSMQAAAGCVPSSATLKYAADDYFAFYVNGNLVAGANGTQFDQGNPPASVSIPVAYFNASGTDYFAAEVINSSANLVGANWVISIVCSDGSLSYVTSADNAYKMYDDTGGSTPPAVDGGGNHWYDPAWTDPLTQFNATPIPAPPMAWFNPVLQNPVTNTNLPALSASSSGVQNSTTEKIYFRESITLPVITLTPTPTPYPTACGVTPSFFQSSILNNSGCTGSGNPTTWS